MLTEIKKGHTGHGLLVENDGYISIDYKDNRKLCEAIGDDSNDAVKLPRPFVVSAVFQKYGIENANGRIYPEDTLKREVAKYQKAIEERRAYGECYAEGAKCLTASGWKDLSDVQVGEEVLTLNCETKEIENKKVVKVISYDHDGDMIHIKGEGIDALVTMEHKFPLFDNEGNFIYYLRATELIYNDFVEYPNIKTMDGLINLHKISISVEPYNGKVYCIEVEDNHNFYVMSNGFCHWTGNCNHPEGSCIDLGRIAMNIIELHWEGRTLVGKIEIPITEGYRKFGMITCLADMVAHWIVSGLKVGVSSRALGSVEKVGNVLMVGDDLELVCWDVVSQPSTPNAWISTDANSLRPYIESEEKKGTIISEGSGKYKKFDKWLLK